MWSCLIWKSCLTGNLGCMKYPIRMFHFIPFQENFGFWNYWTYVHNRTISYVYYTYTYSLTLPYLALPCLTLPYLPTYLYLPPYLSACLPIYLPTYTDRQTGRQACMFAHVETLFDKIPLKTWQDKRHVHLSDVQNFGSSRGIGGSFEGLTGHQIPTRPWKLEVEDSKHASLTQKAMIYFVSWWFIKEKWSLIQPTNNGVLTNKNGGFHMI